ncbi:hypothetical protein BJ508DRAFT_84945 [Ascobolus immersus RN42]|uniref:Uncharacterized protein n=1 Tax=Ascobolus immersus RN42 TaxID=1160509 RepID=A0A3N4HBQ5_ASCIM|nr:hypothetical protein BJ508DRAFT_84945 [Ascobolus immersus RN42]
MSESNVNQSTKSQSSMATAKQQSNADRCTLENIPNPIKADSGGDASDFTAQTTSDTTEDVCETTDNSASTELARLQLDRNTQESHETRHQALCPNGSGEQRKETCFNSISQPDASGLHNRENKSEVPFDAPSKTIAKNEGSGNGHPPVKSKGEEGQERKFQLQSADEGDTTTSGNAIDGSKEEIDTTSSQQTSAPLMILNSPTYTSTLTLLIETVRPLFPSDPSNFHLQSLDSIITDAQIIEPEYGLRRIIHPKFVMALEKVAHLFDKGAVGKLDEMKDVPFPTGEVTKGMKGEDVVIVEWEEKFEMLRAKEKHLKKVFKRMLGFMEIVTEREMEAKEAPRQRRAETKGHAQAIATCEKVVSMIQHAQSILKEGFEIWGREYWEVMEEKGWGDEQRSVLAERERKKWPYSEEVMRIYADPQAFLEDMTAGEREAMAMLEEREDRVEPDSSSRFWFLLFPVLLAFLFLMFGVAYPDIKMGTF